MRISALLSVVVESILAFEADEIDAAYNAAWSVVVTGRAQLVTDPQIVERLDRAAEQRSRLGVGRGCAISATGGAALADEHYSHPLRLNAMYKPPDSTMMSKLDQMNPLVLAKPGYGRFCP